MSQRNICLLCCLVAILQIYAYPICLLRLTSPSSNLSIFYNNPLCSSMICIPHVIVECFMSLMSVRFLTSNVSQNFVTHAHPSPASLIFVPILQISCFSMFTSPDFTRYCNLLFFLIVRISYFFSRQKVYSLITFRVCLFY